MEIDRIPAVLKVLPKDILEEFLFELNRDEHNRQRYLESPPRTLYQCINCLEWTNTKKGWMYWNKVANGIFPTPSYNKYLKTNV